MFGKLKQPLDELVIQKLFEIADRLADQATQGKLASDEFTVGTEWCPVIGGWLNATIYNDGASDVYIRLEDLSGDKPWAMREAPLKSGESLVLDLEARPHRLMDDPVAGVVKLGSPTIWLICQSGTATVRVFRLI